MSPLEINSFRDAVTHIPPLYKKANTLPSTGVPYPEHVAKARQETIALLETCVGFINGEGPAKGTLFPVAKEIVERFSDPGEKTVVME